MQLINRPGLEQVTEPSPSSVVLATRDLSKAYGRGKRRFEAVNQVSLTLHRGEVLAFLGPNGAGKTTTIKMISGLVRPDRGQVRVVGEDPHRSARALRNIGAVLEGNRNLYWRLTPEENLEYFGVLRQVPRKIAHRRGLELLARFGLEEKRRTPVQNLSRGMQQKVAIAVSLIHNPQLLLLDEPTLGLDVEASETVKTLVRQIAKEGRAILLTTHQLDVAEELSDRVAIIRRGRMITQQSTESLLREFSDSAYRLEVDGVPTETQRVAIARLGGHVDGQSITYAGTSEGLYALLAALQPLPLMSVQRDRADLTQVFLKLVQDNQEPTS
ncbi:ABC transporter ATP-binding protein [Oscillatoria sp. CS-180]|uniref:ABC transporter ATP-binding protein n=1 Tax=Oscillatoria sp. CS-180 TaxID=3021720 RepID=UPI00232EB440|nr:ABC transporter ATP-binding protein [Oscillatoria sp. CS-180]MDB9526915.1 ABC transporter ATP-binding protein [Oscillatoria sp. CS-180]